MANICLQTYLVSNLSALLTRADVGIYTMRCLVLLRTNEALEVSTAMCLVILGWIVESALEVFTAISHQWMYVSAMLTALQQFCLVRFFEPIASKMQCLEVRWCSIWFDIAGKSNFFARFGKLLVALALRKGVASALRLFQNFRVAEAREGLNQPLVEMSGNSSLSIIYANLWINYHAPKRTTCKSEHTDGLYSSVFDFPFQGDTCSGSSR